MHKKQILQLGNIAWFSTPCLSCGTV